MAPPPALVSAILSWLPSLSANLRRPAGPVGWFLGKFLFPKVNADMIGLAVDRLQLLPGERVLEVGFGPGYGLSLALKALASSPASSPSSAAGGDRPAVVGLDFSESMVSMTSDDLRLPIAEGRLKLILGDVCAPEGLASTLSSAADGSAPTPQVLSNEEAFDGVFHLNCFYFWPDKAAACRNLAGVLRPGGRMVTVYDKGLDERGARIFTDDIVFSLETYTQGLRDAGFVNIEKDEVHQNDKEFIVVKAIKAA